MTSGPAWCMKFNKASGQLAVGTEEGYVCLYNVVEDGLDFAKVNTYAIVVLCLFGNFLVYGSARFEYFTIYAIFIFFYKLQNTGQNFLKSQDPNSIFRQIHLLTLSQKC